jgi:hypothetical protein
MTIEFERLGLTNRILAASTITKKRRKARNMEGYMVIARMRSAVYLEPASDYCIIHAHTKTVNK